MKKSLLTVSFLLIFSLCGCSRLVPTILTDNDGTTLIPTPLPFAGTDIETLKSWSFQFNEGTNDYSVFFALLDKDDEYISGDVDIDIRIVNDNDEQVYKGTKSVSKKDFSYYTSQAAGEQYLANVRIPAPEIASGTSANGTVFMTIYKADLVDFGEVSCSALYCLPVADVQVTFDSFPLDLKVKGFDGTTESIIQITDVSYTFEKDYLPQLKIIISGEKTYGNTNSGYDIISYKLYDSEGYMVSTNHIFLNSLSQGDKFKNDSTVIYDVIPGESYTLKLVEYDWAGY
ncbi:MAG: hypothetical protein HDR17_11190 [Lachnospiraceae bacterium]|nr:hypothetical protein [Lachnospiraceae bacterium]